MLFVAVLAAACCVAFSVPPPGCQVSDWGEWSECRTGCTVKTGKSYPMDASQKAKGTGRKNMAKLMQLKRMASLERQRCKERNECPEMYPPPSKIGARTDCVNGFAGEYPCSNVDMLAFINFARLGFSGSVSGNDIWVWHDVDQGENYALMGTTQGTSFVRVTNPEEPEVLGILRTETSSSTWRDMKVIGNYAYIVSEAAGHGMQIFDLTRLRSLSDDPSPPELGADRVYSGVSNTHNIVANPDTNKVFLVGSTYGAADLCSGGLHIVDVSTPLEPRYIDCLGQDGYVHDAECLIYDGPDTRYNGKEICFGYNEDTFTIYDLSDNAEKLILSTTSYDGVRYTHQGWATEDLNWVLLNDELDEQRGEEENTKTYVWDIRDLENPVLTQTYFAADTSIDHNLYIRGDYAHLTNYEAGYRILGVDRLNDGGELYEVGYFDVYPSRTTANFEGSWSNYPWLDYAGGQFTVVSSINYGLFILQPNTQAIEAQKAKPLTGTMERFRETIYGTEGATCPHLVETKKCVAPTC